MSTLVEIPHEEVMAAGEAHGADLGQQRGGAHTWLLFAAGAEVVPIRVDHARAVFGDPLDALQVVARAYRLTVVQRQAEAA